MTINSSGIPIPVEVVQGGTGADNANDAAVNLGVVRLTGDTMLGYLILNADPTNPLGAVTKQYADSISAGLTVKDAVVVATTGALTVTYANGAAGVGATLTNAGVQAALEIDGVTLLVNDRVLVKDQASQLQNGIYSVTDVGSGATDWVMTRTTDYDTISEIEPGNLVVVNEGTVNAVTSWLQTATIATIGVDSIVFSQFTAGVGANRALSNLTTTSINTDLLPSGNGLWDLGTGALTWRDAYLERVQTGSTAADTLQIGAWDVDGAVFTSFITLTANNTPTCSLSASVTGSTQALGTDNTTLATTAFVQDAIDDLAADKANTSLNNLAAVAINTSLVSDTDIADDLGTAAIRWNNVYAAALSTGDTAADTLVLRARDVDGAAWIDFITLTANNTPTCALSGSVTGVTQAPNTNTTQLATCAYVDAATGGGSGANVALSNLAGVAINTTLVSDTDITDDLGTQAIRWRNVYAQTLQTGDTAADTLSIGAWDVDGAAFVSFFTLTAGNTPTAVLSGSVTGTTQAALTSNTTLATTAYADSAAGARANVALSNLSGVAINASLVPGADNTIDIGSAAARWANIYGVNHRTGTTNGNTMVFQARDVDGAAWVDFITFTAANTPTCAISGATITGGTISGLTTPLAVADGGTGRATSTTAYGTICAGTTATGALQTVSPGTSGQALVSGGASALPAYGTLGVIGGGTGVATLTTAYGTLCAGTTATGAVQTVSPGTTGQVLVSAGAAALPAYGTAPVTGGGTGLTSATAYAVLCGGTTSTGAFQSIASVGSSGNVLTSNGAGALPTFQAPAGGSGALIFIASATASASATIDFNNNLSATYDNYLIVAENVLPATNAVTTQFRVGTGAGPTYQTSSYSGNGTCYSGAASYASGTGALDLTIASRTSNTASRVGGGQVWIKGVNSGVDKLINSVWQNWDSTSAYDNINNLAGRWQGATVLTSARFLMSSGNISAGIYKLYGIANS
jgi:hypothetical protein